MYDKIPDNFQPASEDPLFAMTTGNPNWLAAKIPPIIKGTWSKGRTEYYFTVELPSALAGERFSITVKDHLNDAIPLLNYIMKHKAATIMQGEHHKGSYIVYGIHPVFADMFAADIPLPFFYEMVERIRKPIPKGLNLGSMLPPPLRCVLRQSTRHFWKSARDGFLLG